MPRVTADTHGCLVSKGFEAYRQIRSAVQIWVLDRSFAVQKRLLHKTEMIDESCSCNGCNAAEGSFEFPVCGPVPLAIA